MKDNKFFTLTDVIYSHPLPMFIAFFIVLGMWCFADLMSKNKLRIDNTFQRISLAYVVVVSIVSILVHALYFLRIHSVYPLKIIGSLFIVLGLYYFVKIVKNLIRKEVNFNKLLEVKGDNKIQLIAIIAIAFPLLLSALGPPTDPDSLDYHLGVPLDWLRNYQAYPRHDWMASRLVGIGESINLFGLINGTDILGQIIQYSGLIVAWVGVSIFAGSLRKKYLSALLVFASPVVLSLVTSQKPHLFPSAALILGVLTILKTRKNHDRQVYLLSIICILFAVSNKHSFLIAGIVAIGVSIVIAKKNKDIKFALLTIFLLFFIINFPLYLRNYQFYGDPLSPMFEFLKANPEKDVLDFANLIRLSEGGLTLKKVLMLPFTLAFTTKLNNFPTVLGVGVLGIFVMYKVNKLPRVILSLSIITALCVLFTGQFGPRYYLESYFFLSAAIVSANWNNRHVYLKRGLLLQSIPVAFSAIFGALTLFPGAFTDDLRDHVMSKHAFCYEEAKWIDKHLPNDSKIIAYIRSNALIPRPFVVPDRIKNSSENLINVIKKNKVTAVMFPYLHKDFGWVNLESYLDNTVDEEKTFSRVTRNPLNTGTKYKMRLFTLGKELK